MVQLHLSENVASKQIEPDDYDLMGMDSFQILNGCATGEYPAMEYPSVKNKVVRTILSASEYSSTYAWVSFRSRGRSTTTTTSTIPMLLGRSSH